MKALSLLIGLSFVAFTSHAADEGRLACWNIFAPNKDAGANKPILTATLQGNQVVGIRFNTRDEYFELYVREVSEYSEHWKSEGKLTSTIKESVSDFSIDEIAAKSSPYYGQMRYGFTAGNYSYRSAWYNNAGEYGARLILPKDLGREALKKFRIRNAQERSNAVVILDPPFLGNQAGDNYLRLYCLAN